MSLNDISNVSITLSTSSVTQPGFGTPLIFGYNTIFDEGELVRTYTSATAMSEDGFATSSPEYKAAQVFFSANPRGQRIKVGKRTSAATQRIFLTPTAVNLGVYSGTIVSPTGVSEDFSVTADGSATVAEIVTLLIAEINGNANAVTATDGTTHVVVTADVANTFFTFENLSSNLAFSDQTAAVNIAAQLDAIQSEDSDFYAIISTSHGADEIEDIAAWTEAAGKLFGFSSQDSNTKTNSTSDVFSTAETASYNRTFGMYHQNVLAFAEAGEFGKFLPYAPGSETWVMKALNGVPVSDLTETEQGHLKDKKALYYIDINGASVVYPVGGGKVFSGEYIDVIRFRDWLQSRIQIRVFSLLNREIKVRMDDFGASQVKSEVYAALLEGERVGGLVAGSSVVTVPEIKDVSPTNKAARLLPEVRFTATLAGAIHSIQITGVLSV